MRTPSRMPHCAARIPSRMSSFWRRWQLLVAAFVTISACTWAETSHRRAEQLATAGDTTTQFAARRLLRENVSMLPGDDARFPDGWAPALDAPGDHSWTIARTIGILTMQGGFALLEAGSVRPANKANIMMKNMADMSVGLLLYAAYGYSLTFTSFSPFMGGHTRVLLLGAESEYTHVLHQFSFAATTGTIVSGAVAERVNFKAYVLLTGWIISVLYSIVAHWAWTDEGWLRKVDFFDFAGAGVVHLLGGACACVSTCYVGPRIGRFGALEPWLLRWQELRTRLGRSITFKSRAKPSVSGSTTQQGGVQPNLRRAQVARAKEAQAFRVSDPVNVIYGTFILFVGWISFNCSGTYGLTSGREHLAARVGVVTCMGGAAGKRTFASRAPRYAPPHSEPSARWRTLT